MYSFAIDQKIGGLASPEHQLRLIDRVKLNKHKILKLFGILIDDCSDILNGGQLIKNLQQLLK
jgi:hypothetical protein